MDTEVTMNTGTLRKENREREKKRVKVKRDEMGAQKKAMYLSRSKLTFIQIKIPRLMDVQSGSVWIEKMKNV